MEQNSTVTHICLIGDDPSANLTPVVDQNIASDRVVIVYQNTQKSEAETLSRVIKTRGYEAELYVIESSFNTEDVKFAFMQLFDAEMSHPSTTWLNASNGSRYYILAAYEVARAYQVPIYIVEPKHDALCWLYPENKPLTPVADKIKLHEFMAVYGITLHSQQNEQGISTELRSIGQNWLNQANKLTTGLAKLNYLAQSADNNFVTSQPQDDAMLADDSLQWLLNDLEITGLIKQEGKKINFLNEANRFFANGGWLEEITFSYIRGLSHEISALQDDGHSVEIIRQNHGATIKNELDVVALVNNKLHVIECKTKRFYDDNSVNTLYKIDSLAESLGGLKCKAALVTFYPLSKHSYARAKELDIKIFNISQLTNFKAALKQWLITSAKPIIN